MNTVTVSLGRLTPTGRSESTRKGCKTSPSFIEQLRFWNISVKIGRSSGQDFESPKFLEVLIIAKNTNLLLFLRHLLPSTFKHSGFLFTNLHHVSLSLTSYILSSIISTSFTQPKARPSSYRLPSNHHISRSSSFPQSRGPLPQTHNLHTSD